MYKSIAIGTDDFKEIIDGDNLYIDKTLFIKDIIDNTDKIILFPRPRRFGKTLNMSMLSYYFDINLNSKKLFKELEISKCDKKYLNEMNKYPIIYLTLKDCKSDNYEQFIDDFKLIISNLYKKHLYLLESDCLNETDKIDFNNLYLRKEERKLSKAIAFLVDLLNRYYNEQVIVLLDEYDAPILNSYFNDYYDECITFMKGVFSSTFKNNLSLKKGVITGILRISKEGLFSDANNISIYNMTDINFSKSFGFTEEEVKECLKLYDIENKFKDVKKWYDGYLFGREIIYNPWSILNFLKNPEHDVKPYWVNTGGVGLLKDLIYNVDNAIMLDEYHKLLDSGKIEHVNLDLYMDLKSLNYDSNTIWTLFMLAGYLTPTKYCGTPFDVTLKIPNLEIKYNLESICANWFKNSINNVGIFDNYFLTNNMNNFKETFTRIVEQSFSYYDVGINQGENFYHAFCMGLLYSGLNNFEIKSNRESGYGRYDLVLTPKNNSCKYAYIIEFKAIENDNFNRTLRNAIKQINEKKYDDEFKNIYNVTKIVIVFKRKEIKIEIRR